MNTFIVSSNKGYEFELKGAPSGIPLSLKRFPCL